MSKIYLLALATALMQGCSDARKSDQEESVKSISNEAPASESLAGSAGIKEEMADTTTMPFVFSSASKIGKIDSIKKFIRTVDIKFKVKNVEKSTYKIEDITHRFDGFVTYTHLNARINYTESFRVREDSLLQRVHFVVENNITVRVPKKLLDTTLKQIVSQIDFLDYRIIKAEDVSYDALKNRMHQKRFNRYQERITKTTDKSNKTNAVVNAENGLYEKEADADQSVLDDMILNDKVEYSTVQLYIYQDEKIKENTVFSQPNTPSFKTSFGKEFVHSVKFGWELIEEIILVLIKIWPLILIGFGVYFLIKRMIRRKPSAQE